MAEIEKNKYFLRNIFNISPGIDLTIGLSKYVKVKALVSLPFLRKRQLLFALFPLFLVLNRVGSHFKGRNQNLIQPILPARFLINFM